MAGVADRPRRGDDDEATPSEVTAPPWLRTGPTPGQEAAAAAAAAAAASESAPAATAPAAASDPARSSTSGDGRGDEVPRRAGAGPQGPSREITPNRIRLGRGGPADEPAREPTTRPDAGSGGRRSRDLSSLPLGADRPVTERSAGAGTGPTASPGHSGRARRVAVFAAAGVAVLAGSAVIGFLLTRAALSRPVRRRRTAPRSPNPATWWATARGRWTRRWGPCWPSTTPTTSSARPRRRSRRSRRRAG